MTRDGNAPHVAAGSVARPLLWLVLGLVLLVLAALAIAPELLASPRLLTGGLGIALVAGLPGALLLLRYVGRRRRLDGTDGEDR